MNLRRAMATFRGHEEPHFRIVQNRKWGFALSGTFIVLSLIGLTVRGLNYSIDFKGGALLQYPDNAAVSVAQVESTMARFGRSDAVVQILNGNQVQIRTQSLNDLSD